MDDVIVSESAKYEIIDKILKEEQDNINNNHIISDVDMVDKIVKIIKEYVNANYIYKIKEF